MKPAKLTISYRQRLEKNMGLGESVGKYILETRLEHSDCSLLAAGYRLGIPVTVHVSIGQDIVHQLPNCNGRRIRSNQLS